MHIWRRQPHVYSLPADGVYKQCAGCKAQAATEKYWGNIFCC